ncbi:MAG: Holliday junction branch migration protein RuvA [Elusimicrobiota bacterium]|nr:Holliday junction branch migration protein RuvA [Elusimicrobiota bacterium]
MIAHLRGNLISKKEDSVVLDVAGVGYELNMCALSIQSLPSLNEETSLYVSESLSMYSGTILYGFLNQDEKELFELFKSAIPKTGAKKALDYLAKAKKSLPDFQNSIIKKDLKVLTSIFGFTVKTAEKIINGLKNKMDHLSIGGDLKIKAAAINSDNYVQVQNALVSLGFKNAQVKNALTLLENEKLSGKETMEQLLKITLKSLTKG